MTTREAIKILIQVANQEVLEADCEDPNPCRTLHIHQLADASVIAARYLRDNYDPRTGELFEIPKR